MAQNLPAFTLSTIAVNSRQSELPEADFSGGMNKGGSCAPLIGLNTGDYDPKLQDWTVNDQHGNDRDPQTTQHIAGLALAGGGDSAFIAQIYDIDNGDLNDQAAFVVATQNTPPDSSLNGTTSAINRTGKTVPSGARCWGTNPVVGG